MLKHKIVYWDKEVTQHWHFFDILPQLRNLENYHHLISPFMYKSNTIDTRNAALFRMQWEKYER